MTTTERTKATDVEAALRRHHANQGTGAWVCIDEALSGYAGGIDLLAIGAWRSSKTPALIVPKSGGAVDVTYPLVAYEIKVSRSDFRKELVGSEMKRTKRGWSYGHGPWPAKAERAIERSNYFLFAVPAGLLHDDEIERRAPWQTETDALLPVSAPRKGALWLPEGVGLVEVSTKGVRVRVKAPPRNAQPLTRGENAEIMRRIDYRARGLRGTDVAMGALQRAAA